MLDKWKFLAKGQEGRKWRAGMSKPLMPESPTQVTSRLLLGLQPILLQKRERKQKKNPKSIPAVGGKGEIPDYPKIASKSLIFVRGLGKKRAALRGKSRSVQILCLELWQMKICLALEIYISKPRL